MEDMIKKGILNIIIQAITACKQEDTLKLESLSKEIIHNASIYQDKDTTGMAIIIYALQKIVNRSQGITDSWDSARPHIIQELINAKKSLMENKDSNYRLIMKNLLKEVGRIDEKLHLYIQDVINKARLVKGSNIYEHGVSIGRAAELLGLSQYELMGYVGKTKIIDQYSEEVIPVTKRMDFTKKVFGL